MYLSISASNGESCTGSLGDSIAVISTHPEIGGNSLGVEKYSASRCHYCEEEPNEEEDPRNCIREETINRYSASPGTVSMFKMLPQTVNKFSKVIVKHGKWFWCAICDIHVKNRYYRDFGIGCWGEHKRNGGHEKALTNNPPPIPRS